MSTRRTVETAIGVALDELIGRDGHHDFQNMATRLASQIVSKRLIPATGPVGAGGDQGRDAESHPGDLDPTPVYPEFGLEDPVEHPLVLAAYLTTREDSVREKILDDIESAISRGAEPRTFLFFTNARVPVGERHELEDEVEDEYGITLMLFDGRAIVEKLSEPELFWIAEEALGLSSEIYPEPDGLDEDYYEIVERWRHRDGPAETHQDVVELRRAIRTATWNEAAKSDLGFLLGKLQPLVEAGSRKAFYETFVARLRGLDNTEGLEEHLVNYLEAVGNINTIGALEDAVCIVQYAWGAIQRGHDLIERDRLLEYGTRLEARIVDLLDSATDTHRICHLRELAGSLSLWKSMAESGSIDWEPVLDYWSEIPEIAEDAPFYDVSRFQDRLMNTTDLLEVPDEVLEILEELSRISSSKVRDFEMGETYRDLSLHERERGRHLQRVDYLHKLVDKWASAETAKGHILALLFLSRSYLELKLTVAAKYYAMAAATVVWNNPNPELKKYLFDSVVAVMDACHMQGQWNQFWGYAPLAMTTYANFSPYADRDDQDDPLVRVVFHSVTTCGIASAVDEKLADEILSRANESGLGDWFSMCLETCAGVWDGTELEDIKTQALADLVDVPFNDLGDERRVRFQMRGVQWECFWNPEDLSDAVAEEFVCALQLITTMMADKDLALVPGGIRLHLTPGFAEQEPGEVLGTFPADYIVPLSTPEERTVEAWEEHTAGLVATVFSVLDTVILASNEEIHELMENLGKEGLFDRLLCGRPYHVEFSEFNLPDEKRAPFESEFTWSSGTDPWPDEVPELAELTSPGPGYDYEEAAEYVEDTYDNLFEILSEVLPELRSTPWFQEVVSELRDKGWLDWHILGALASYAMNRRSRKICEERGLSREEVGEVFKELMTTNTHVQMEDFPDEGPPIEELVMQEKMNRVSVLANRYGRIVRRTKPNSEGIARVLRTRYGYRTIDVNHEPIFGEEE